MDDLTFYGVLDDSNVYFVLPWIISMMYYVLGLANVKQHLPEARTLLTFLDNTYTESDTAYPVFLVVTLSALKASAYAGEFLLQATSNCAIAVNFLWVLLAFLINPTFFSSIISLRFPVVEQFSVICPILHSFSVFLWIAEKECRQIIRVIAQHRSVYALPSVILWFHISILVPKMCRKLGITIWILQFSTFDAMQPAHFDNAFLLCFGTILTSLYFNGAKHVAIDILLFERNLARCNGKNILLHLWLEPVTQDLEYYRLDILGHILRGDTIACTEYLVLLVSVSTFFRWAPFDFFWFDGTSVQTMELQSMIGIFVRYNFSTRLDILLIQDLMVINAQPWGEKFIMVNDLLVGLFYLDVFLLFWYMTTGADVPTASIMRECISIRMVILTLSRVKLDILTIKEFST